MQQADSDLVLHLAAESHVSGTRASASTTSPPMRCSAPWARRGASRKPPPTTRAAPIRGGHDWLTVEDHVIALLLAGDRPGHDRRYAIDPTRISTELGWQPRHSFEEGHAATVRWYLDQKLWCDQARKQGGYSGGRLGVLAGAT
jgi:hypothetical protein